MLQNIRQIYGKKLGASDGEMGKIKDLYFDDQSWSVRYVVADTGPWLTGRLVLLSPHAFLPGGKENPVLRVRLSRKQVEDSPPIESHRPVSRQFEEEYYRYYGWPAYWEGGGMLGVGGTPVTFPAQRAVQSRHPADDPHLRSTEAVTGYHIQAVDGTIGHVSGFLIDDEAWTVSDLVVETGHWYSGREIQIPVRRITRISHDDSYVFVNHSKADILRTPEDHVVRVTPPPGVKRN